MTLGPDGAFWFVRQDSGIGRITTTGDLTHFSIPDAVSTVSSNLGPVTYFNLGSITTGPDGALWLTVPGPIDPAPGTPAFAGKIDRITTSGVVTEFPVGAPNSEPYKIVSGPDGALWFVEAGCRVCDITAPSKIGRITTAGAVTEFALQTGHIAGDLATGPDGAIWFTERTSAAETYAIGRITVDGTITEFPVSIVPGAIILGADGALWFTETLRTGDGFPPSPTRTFQIGRISVTGVQNYYTVPSPNGFGGGIVSGSDGAIWFTEITNGKIGRIVPPAASLLVSTAGSGTVTSSPAGIDCGTSCSSSFAAGQNVSLTATPASGWNFVGWGGACSGSSCTVAMGTSFANVYAIFAPIAPTGGPLFSSLLPSSRSVTVGTTATVFATIINTGATAATGCSIAPIGSNPGGFTYRSTDSATNIANGVIDAPVNIAGGGSQSFIIGFTPTAAIAPSNVQLGFSCTNTGPAAVFPGVNTLLLSASTSPTPDVVALASTASNDGIMHVTGAGGTGAFAVATVNVGAGGPITASVNTGGVSLPLSLSICPTNPVTAACLTPPAPTAQVTINANETPTFSIFAMASGVIPFSPGVNRIFVQFSDSGGAIRGSTNVAVETQ
jgi:streptogramin lyase